MTRISSALGLAIVTDRHFDDGEMGWDALAAGSFCEAHVDAQNFAGSGNDSLWHIGARSGHARKATRNRPATPRVKPPRALAYNSTSLSHPTCIEPSSVRAPGSLAMDAKRHKSLYLPDGNLAILSAGCTCERVVFRVHKSTLSMHSTVFNDMFSLPTAPNVQEMYDGVPLVIATDEPKAWEDLLGILYHTKCVFHLPLNVWIPTQHRVSDLSNITVGTLGIRKDCVQP